MHELYSPCGRSRTDFMQIRRQLSLSRQARPPSEFAPKNRFVQRSSQQLLGSLWISLRVHGMCRFPRAVHLPKGNPRHLWRCQAFGGTPSISVAWSVQPEGITDRYIASNRIVSRVVLMQRLGLRDLNMLCCASRRSRQSRGTDTARYQALISQFCNHAAVGLRLRGLSISQHMAP